MTYKSQEGADAALMAFDINLNFWYYEPIPITNCKYAYGSD
jgi:hypothetical protein